MFGCGLPVCAVRYTCIRYGRAGTMQDVTCTVQCEMRHAVTRACVKCGRTAAAHSPAHLRLRSGPRCRFQAALLRKPACHTDERRHAHTGAARRSARARAVHAIGLQLGRFVVA